jgi:hypothetical protein
MFGKAQRRSETRLLTELDPVVAACCALRPLTTTSRANSSSTTDNVRDRAERNEGQRSPRRTVHLAFVEHFVQEAADQKLPGVYLTDIDHCEQQSCIKKK